MLRAAAKHHARVTVLVDPADYRGVLDELRAGVVTEATRRRLAAKTYAHTAHYDAMISSWLRRQQADASWPGTMTPPFRKKQDLRYGENPHQTAAFYADPLAAGASIATATQLQGKELSYNNIADADTALECVRQFDPPACVIVSTPILRRGTGRRHARSVPAGLRTGPGLGIRRHHRLQSPARRADRGRHHRAPVRRSHRRARRSARGRGPVRGKAEHPRAADGRSRGCRARRLRTALGRGRPAGAVAR
jgi:hypothetical protein